MATYNNEDLQRLIDAYSGELMNTYGNRYSSPTKNELYTDKTIDSSATDSPPIVQDKPQDTPNELTDIGRLQVRVSTENEAVPIVGAVVTVTDANGNLKQLLTTDGSGLTTIIELPTKDRLLSLSPNNPSPYAVYTIDVTAEGYFQKRFTDLPIYGGVTAVQSVSMIPLPEAGDDDRVLTYPQNGGPTML